MRRPGTDATAEDWDNWYLAGEAKMDEEAIQNAKALALLDLPDGRTLFHAMTHLRCAKCKEPITSGEQFTARAVRYVHPDGYEVSSHAAVEKRAVCVQCEPRGEP